MEREKHDKGSTSSRQVARRRAAAAARQSKAKGPYVKKRLVKVVIKLINIDGIVCGAREMRQGDNRRRE